MPSGLYSDFSKRRVVPHIARRRARYHSCPPRVRDFCCSPPLASRSCMYLDGIETYSISGRARSPRWGCVPSIARTSRQSKTTVVTPRRSGRAEKEEHEGGSWSPLHDFLCFT